MTLVQKGFAAQRINAKGKAFKYDSIECLLADLKARPPISGERVYLSDWSRPSAEAATAESAFILKGGGISSPMGGALAAFQSRDSALAYQGRMGGDLFAWSDLWKP
jgi:copper chaperone NosL